MASAGEGSTLNLPEIQVAAGFNSIPLKVLMDAAAGAAGTEVLVTVLTGYIYRGWLQSADALMNVDLHNVTVTCAHRPGFVQRHIRVFLRGPSIVSIVLPQEFETDVKAKGKAVGKWLRKSREAAKKARRRPHAGKVEKRSTKPSAQRPKAETLPG